MTLDYDQGVLDQAGADIPALQKLELFGTQQYHRAERYGNEIDELMASRNRMMVLVGVLALVIVILAAALIARSL